MRPRDKCSAHFGAVPARYDTEPERLFCFDVTRRKILHEVCFQESARSSIERGGEASGCSANNHWFSSRRRAGQSPQVRPRPDRDDGCRPEPAPPRISSRRSAPWQPLQATKPPEPTEAGFRIPPADRAGLSPCSRRPPESAGCRLLFVRPCRGACRGRAAYHSPGALASMPCASDRSIELIESISIAELRGAAAGTMIMVATRRNTAKDNPSIIS